ncbi:MAG: type II toxin-antitoxin system RelE/ParE family toxin [bacterium]|nr:type II toxin-antitoxin system RelE/ParE family toxin [bacterium]
MSKRYRVEWLETARRELHQITAALAEKSPRAALRQLESIENTAESLATLPERGRWIPELATLSNRSYRELQIPPLRLLYRVDADKVVVLGLFDGRRDLEEVILGRVFRYLHGEG